MDQIGEDFAPGKEQDNLDAENEGLSENPDFNHLDPALIEEHLSKDTGTSKVTNYVRLSSQTRQNSVSKLDNLITINAVWLTSLSPIARTL